MKSKNTIRITPQKGFQENFLSSPADIVIGGGGAGVGKTHAEIMESMRHIDNPQFSVVFFRRTYQQIMAPDGLWDAVGKIYPHFGATSSKNVWHFPSGAKAVFSHLQHEKDKYSWQGSQIPCIIWDELTHFTRGQFFYLLSRNRSTSGITPYVRATCNPDADSWVRDFIDWYIGDDGFIIPARSGVLRYFSISNDTVVWGNSRQEVMQKIPTLENVNEVKSFTFIEGDIFENKILLKHNPEYLGNLRALSEEDQLRLLKRNWNVKLDDSVLFSYVKFKDVFSNEFVKTGTRRIVADIAIKGNDLLVIWVLEGRRVLDLIILDKSSGRVVIDTIRLLMKTWYITASNVCFDADGVGGGLTGFIEGAIEFHGNGKVFRGEKYLNRRAQMYYHLSDAINGTFPKTADDTYYIPPAIANRVFPYKTPRIYRGKTIKWVLLHQIKAIKQAKQLSSGKLMINPKKEIINTLGGISPDLLDALALNEIFNFITTPQRRARSKAELGLF